MPYYIVLITELLVVCSEAMDKLRQAIASGRDNQTTKRNKILSRADKELNKFGYELSSATAEVD